MYWVRMAAAAFLAIVLAAFSATYSFSRISTVAQPLPSPLASAISPMRHADANLPADLQGIDTDRLASLAIRSLRIEPLNPKAIRMLALERRAAGDSKAVSNLLKMSQKVSRRDGTTQILLVEKIALDSDTKPEDIIRQYDAILRVNPDLAPQLYPSFIQALAFEGGRDALVGYVRLKRRWVTGLLNSALYKDHGPAAVAETLLKSFPGKNVVFPDNLQSALLFEKLAAKGKYRLMRTLFLRLKDSDARWLTTFDVQQANGQEKYGPMALQFHNSANHGASLVQTGTRTGIEVFANSETQADVVSKLLFTDGENYQLTTTQNSDVQGVGHWKLTCLGYEGKAKGVGNPASIVRNSAQLSANCPVWSLQFRVAGSDSQAEVRAVLPELKIRKN